MGLINCPDCGKKFSDRIDSCPNCYCPKEEALKDNIASLKEKLAMYIDEVSIINYNDKKELEKEITDIDVDDTELLELILFYSLKNNRMDLNNLEKYLKIKKKQEDSLDKLVIVKKYKKSLEKYFCDLFYERLQENDEVKIFYNFPINHMKQIKEYNELMCLYDEYEIKYDISPNYNYETIENFNRYYINYIIEKELIVSSVVKKYSIPLYDYLVTGINFIDKVLEIFDYDSESLLEILKCKLVMINHLLTAEYSFEINNGIFRKETLEVEFPNGISQGMRKRYLNEQKKLQEKINDLYLEDIDCTKEELREELSSLDKRKDKERINVINKILSYPYDANDIFEPWYDYKCDNCGHYVKENSSQCNKCNTFFE